MTTRRSMGKLKSLMGCLALVGLPWPASASVPCDGSPMTTAPRTIRTRLGDVTVFEAGRNPVLEPGQKCYFVAPVISIASEGRHTPAVNLLDYGDWVAVSLDLLVTYPTPEEVAAGLRREQPETKASRVAPLAPLNVRIDHPIFEPKLLIADGEASSLNLPQDGYSVLLEPRPGREHLAAPFVEKLRAGQERLPVAYKIREVSAAVRSGKVTWNDLARSHGFATFVQASRQGGVTANQALDASVEILRDLDVALWDEFLEGDRTEYLDAASSLAQNLLASAKSRYVDVAEIREMLAPYKIDRDSSHFDPGYVTSFREDVKNLRKQERHDKYFNDFSHALRTANSNKIQGGLSAGFLGLFTGSGKYKHDFSRMSDEELKQVLDEESYFVDEFDRSFKIEWEGKWIERLSLRIYEDLNLDVERVGTEVVAAYRVSSRFAWVPAFVSPTESRVDVIRLD